MPTSSPDALNSIENLLVTTDSGSRKYSSLMSSAAVNQNEVQWELIRLEGDSRIPSTTVRLTHINFVDWNYPVSSKLLYAKDYLNVHLQSIIVRNVSSIDSSALFDIESTFLSLIDCDLAHLSLFMKLSASELIMRHIHLEEYHGSTTPFDLNIRKSAALQHLFANRSSYGVFKITGTFIEFNLTESHFEHGHSVMAGGALSLSPIQAIGDTRPPSIFISLSNFTANIGSSGGAIAISGVCYVRIEQSNFVDNSALSASGGALQSLSEGFITIRNSNFTGNTATTDGGALEGLGSWLVDHSYFSLNFALRLGGAIHLPSPLTENTFQNAPALTVQKSNFTENGAHFGGGAISVSNNVRETHLFDSSFYDNQIVEYFLADSQLLGGAVLIASNLSVESSYFYGSVASAGGAIALLSPNALRSFLEIDLLLDESRIPSLKISSTRFLLNAAYLGATLLVRDHPSVTAQEPWKPIMTGTTFTNGLAISRGERVGMGGAIGLDNVLLDFSSSFFILFLHNSASVGGAIYSSISDRSIGNLSLAYFEGNHANYCGGDLAYGSVRMLPNSTKPPESKNDPDPPIWGPKWATVSLTLHAILKPSSPSIPDEILPLTEISSSTVRSYVTYPGVERIIEVSGKDYFGQTALYLQTGYSFNFLFNCNSSNDLCEQLELQWSIIPTSHDASSLLAQFTIIMSKPGLHALLTRPVYGYIKILATLDSVTMETSLPLTVRACGAGYGEFRTHLPHPTNGADFMLVNRRWTSTLSNISSINGSDSGAADTEFQAQKASPSVGTPSTIGLFRYSCEICPQYFYSLNGTCSSCASDPSVDSCQGDQITAPSTFWVMKDPPNNTYASIRCAESYCGLGNRCLLGRRGIMCGDCVAGKRESLTSICVSCTKPNWIMFAILFFGLWASVLVLHSMLAVSSGKATILIFFVQTAWSIRLQIPVVSSHAQFSGLYKIADWVLCLWPMNFLQRKILLGSVPFIMMAQLSLTFAGYYFYRWIRERVSASHSASYEYQPLQKELSVNEIPFNTNYGVNSPEDGAKSIGYGADSDDETDQVVEEFSEDSDDSRSAIAKDDLNWQSMEERVVASDSESDLSDFGLSLSSQAFQSLETLDSVMRVESMLENETRIWQIQNAYFHHYRLIRTLLGLFANSFSSVLGIVMSTLGCIDLIDGSRVLAVSPSISCQSPQYRLLRNLLGLIIPYLLFVAAFIFGKLIHSYFKNELSRTDVRFGVWYEMYKPKLFGWKIVEFIRRALVATIGDLLITERTLRASLLSTLMLVSLAVHLIASPYRHRLENNLESISLFFLSFIALLVLWNARLITETSIPSRLSLAIMIGITVLLAAAFGYRAAKSRILRFWKRFRASKSEELF